MSPAVSLTPQALTSASHPPVHRRYAILGDQMVGCSVDSPVRHRQGACPSLRLPPHLCAFRYGLLRGLIFTLSISETHSLMTAMCCVATWT